MLALQRVAGNRSVARLLAGRAAAEGADGAQRDGDQEQRPSTGGEAEFRADAIGPHGAREEVVKWRFPGGLPQPERPGGPRSGRLTLVVRDVEEEDYPPKTLTPLAEYDSGILRYSSRDYYAFENLKVEYYQYQEGPDMAVLSFQDMDMR